MRILDRRALVALVERLGDAEGEAHLVEAGREQPLVAALVECETRANRPRAWTHRCDHVLRSGHLRDPLRIDEARYLDPGHARVHDPADEVRSNLDVEDLRLVLQSVTRADVVDRHAGRSHRVHCSLVA